MIYQKIIDLLPENSDILGLHKYRESVILVPFLVIDNREYILLQVRSKSIRQPGEISFPGGMKEKIDKTLFHTAVRETSEELGISEDYIEVAGQFDTLINPLGMMIKVVIGKLKIDSLDLLTINKDEVEEVFLIPVDWLTENKPETYKLKMTIISRETNNEDVENVYFPAKELNLPEKYWDSWGGVYHKVYVYKYSDKVIWGITAEILHELFFKFL